MVKKITISLLLTFIMAFMLLDKVTSEKIWEQRKIINHDIIFYYAYLPATFIRNDLTLEFVENDARGDYWYLTAPNGGKVMKYTMGLSMLYLPFFTIAHLEAKIFGHEPYGYSMPYQKWTQLSGTVFFILGLFYLRRLLKMFYTDIIVSIALITLLFGTNLYLYVTNDSPYSHAFSFTLITMFTYYSVQWHRKKGLKNSLLLGLLIGLIFLVRPNNILILLFFILYNVGSFRELKLRIIDFITHKKYLFYSTAIAFFVIAPQLIYWKYITGEFLFYSYMEETFYWSSPRILEGLLSYRKGWLVYTPVMIFAIVGFYFLYQKEKKLFSPIISIFIIYVFITFSWWCWWYGGGFSSRSMVDIYALLALALCAFINFIIKKQNAIFTGATSLAFIFCIYLNLGQIRQYTSVFLHWDSMTKEAYWRLFLKSHFDEEEAQALIKSFSPPDYQKAIRGEKEYNFCDF
jgi:hypothetical protein